MKSFFNTDRIAEAGLTQVIMQTKLKDLFYRWFIFPFERFVLFLTFALINVMAKEYFMTVKDQLNERIKSVLLTCTEMGDQECQRLCTEKSCEKNSVNGSTRKIIDNQKPSSDHDQVDVDPETITPEN